MSDLNAQLRDDWADPVTDRTVTPHQPDERCPTNTHCYSCNVDEPDRPGDYLVCGECCHIFRTEQDLIDTENKLRLSFAKFYPEGPMRQAATAPVTTGRAIHTCPLCAHDF